nr:TadE/TadG family type IV pilus assembly protein [Nakamurella sp. PAMC28650]
MREEVGPPQGSTPEDQDCGNSVAEFAMVLVLLLMLFLALVSVGFWAYSRTLLTSASADAARYIANADIPDTAAAERVATLLDGSIAASTSASLQCRSATEGQLVQVTCTMRTPGIISLLDGVMPDITVTGHSVKEVAR